MVDCCESKERTQHPRKHNCPVNGKQYTAVDRNTLLHHVKDPWKINLDKNQGYYFCSDPDCEIVYFGENDMTISKNNVASEVWEKESNPARLVCYCFHVSHAQASADKDLKSYVMQQTKNALCSCETSNPSGRCCLINFPKHTSLIV